MTLEELERSEPDVIVVAACGFGLERTRSEMHPLTDRPEWNALTAVTKGQVFLTDGHHFFNRPGPRLVESLEILAELLHPESIAPRHRGPAWMPL